MEIKETINLLCFSWLIILAVQMGLTTTFADITKSLRQYILLLRCAIANFFIIPLILIVLMHFFKTNLFISVGLLCLIFFPGAIFAPFFAKISKGDTAIAASLMIFCSITSVIISPGLLSFSINKFYGSSSITVNHFLILKIVASSLLVPLFAGILFNQFFQNQSKKAGKVIKIISNFLGAAVCLLILLTQYNYFKSIHLKSIIGMASLFLLSALVGWFMGGQEKNIKKSMMLTSTCRNVALGMLVASTSFPQSPALVAVTIYGIFALLCSLLLAASIKSK